MPAVSNDMLAKYDRPVPRYTSYPTVPHWSGIGSEGWRSSLARGLSGSSHSDISLYVHVPFCRSLCSFCGCTKIISRDVTRAEPFVRSILRELDLKLEEIRATSPLAGLGLGELHLGGGTPTWLPPEVLGDLLKQLKSRFPANGELGISIEVDPRTCTPEHVEVFRREGVRRVSLGVQDFNDATLKAIKREQPFEIVRDLVLRLRESGIEAINFDLVYGLPYQTAATMEETLRKVIDLRPSRIALYSYAHIPQIKVAQRGVEKHGLPDAILKTKLHDTASRKLQDAGYEEIGMDHFALKSDELSQAHAAGRLHRNFMGYTVQNTRLLVGLGPSSLSDSWYGFAQNEKDVALWQDNVEAGRIAPVGGHLLSADDLERRQIILDLMCRFHATCPPGLGRQIGENEVARDGLVTWNSHTNELVVNEKGRPFIRNICAVVDAHLAAKSRETPLFSRSI